MKITTRPSFNLLIVSEEVPEGPPMGLLCRRHSRRRRNSPQLTKRTRNNGFYQSAPCERYPLAHRECLRRPLHDPEAEDGWEAVGEGGAGGHGRPDEARGDRGRLPADDVHRPTGDEAAGAEQERKREGRQQPCGWLSKQAK